MKNNVFKKLIASILTVGILLSSVGVFAVDNIEETTAAASGSEQTATVGTSDNAQNEVNYSDNQNTSDDDIKVSVSSDAENGKISDNKATVTSTEVSWSGSVPLSSSPAGSEDNPYAVSDVAHFLDMSRKINETSSGLKYFKLTNHIDLTGITIDTIDNSAQYGLANTIVSINPTLQETLDDPSNLFFVLDGNNKHISNLTISNDSRNSLGIFGYLNSECVIKNLFIQDISITSTYSSLHAIGTILKNEGTVADCGFERITINANSNNTDDAFMPISDSSFRIYSGIAAAIVDNEGTFTHTGILAMTGNDANSYLHSTHHITITSSGSRSYIGGVIAQNRGMIEKTTPAETVKVAAGENSSYVGGYVAANMTYSSSSSSGIYNANLSLAANGVKGGNFTGAFCGYNTGRIKSCSVNGNNNLKNANTVSTSYDIYMYGGKTYGGLVAANTGIIENCAATNLAAYYADSTPNGIYGGIAGTNTYSVNYCVSTGLVVESDSTIDIYAGGVVGKGASNTTFGVRNCFTLVKLPNTTADLGSVVGIDGDSVYTTKIRNCFYSSVVSTRPSPVSYGGTGAAYGDLQYNYSYFAMKSNAPATLNISDFTYSGWTDASVSLTGLQNSFIRDSAETIALSSTAVSEGNHTVTFTPQGTTNLTQTVYYDTNITLPEGIGPVASNEQFVISSQPLVLRVLVLNSSTINGSGTYESPYEINANQFVPAMKIPYGHFKLTENVNLTENTHPTSTIFWGSLDGNGYRLSDTGTTASKIPLFRGIYGSRSDVPSYDSNAHTSNPANDNAENTKYGVVKNFTYNYDSVFTVGSSILGNLCSGTVLNVTFVSSNNRIFTPTESNVGVAFKTVYGNSYIYGVYNDSIKVTVDGSVNTGLSGLIGVVDAKNTVIDNCGSSCKIDSRIPNTDYCSAFIGEIKSLTGVIQNCYSSGGVTYTAGTLGNNNYLFAAKSVSSAQIYNCFYSPTVYYTDNNGRGTVKAIPDGSYTGTLSLWSFDNSMVVIQQGDFGTLRTNAINNISRYDNDTYSANRSNLSTYFTTTVRNGTGYTASLSYETTVALYVEAAANASDNAELYLKNNATGLVAKANIASSSEVVLDNGYYLIQKPMDLYMICHNQADSSTDNGIYLSSDYHFKLVANIDMTGYTIDQWGKDSHYPFCGTLEGEVNSDGTPKYTISGLNMSSVGTCGLFGFVNGATITGIGIADSGFSGGIYTGALIGQITSRATVANCKVSSSIVSGNAKVGGLIGGISGTAVTSETVISRCFVDSTQVRSNVSGDNASNCGGIIGSVGGDTNMNLETKYAEITNCTVSNSEISATGYNVGGIAGFAPCISNELYGCTVSDSIVSSDYSSISTASVGGIVGTFGGTTLGGETAYPNVVTGTTVTGENASGIVSRIVNFNNNTTTVSCCQVNGSDIVGVGYAGGVTANVGAFSGYTPYADKNIINCKVDSSTKVTAKVAGGIVGVVMSGYDQHVLNVDNCYSYAKVTTTGDKGSKIEGAGGIIGRLATGLDTSGITVSDCISGGEIVGSASLGGIIGLLNSDAHTADVPIVSDCYITATLTQKSIKAYKGLIIGYAGTDYQGASNAAKIKKVVDNAVFSSYGASVSPYGNLADSADTAATYTDVNMGDDGTSGIVVAAMNNTIRRNNVIAGDGTNCITLKTSTAANARFDISNLPNIAGFSASEAKTVPENTAPTLYWESSNTDKLTTGTDSSVDAKSNTNALTRVALLTKTFKGKISVYTFYSGSIGTETVRFTIGFTVIVNGTHKFDGFGSPDRPYKIYDAEDLIAIKEHHDSPLTGETGANFYTASYVLMNDIDLSTVCNDNGVYRSFPSIGNSETPFKGSITSNGSNNYTIRNLYINSTTIQSNGYAGNTSEHTVGGYSESYGIFGYMEDASLSNISFENATIIGGTNSGIIAGVAENTEISNVTVSGEVSIQECGVGGTLVGRSTGALNIDSVNINGEISNSNRTIVVSSQGSAGGILGVSIQNEGSSVTNFVVRNCNVESLANTGAYYAGAVAAQMNGVVSGAYSDSTLASAGVIDNCTVSAVICGGVVGGGSPNSDPNDYGLTIKGVNVVSTSIASRGTTTITTAAGILGRTLASYKYEIKDCNVDSDSSCTANYVAGGILGTDNVSSDLYESGLLIHNCKTYATLTQDVTDISTEFTNNRKLCGVGGAIGLISQSAWLKESDDNATVKVYDCTLGGAYSGSMNVGGIVGQIATQSYFSNRITEPLLSNCIVLNTIAKTVEEETHSRFGLVVGAIEGNVSSSTGNPYPDDVYACNPFINIFYSSYMTSKFELFGESSFYSYQSIDMSEKIYDLNKVSFTYQDGDNSYELPIVMQEFVPGNNQQLNQLMNITPAKFHFSTDIIDNENSTGRLYGKLSGDIINGFSVSGETVGDHTVDSAAFTIQSIESSDTTLFDIIENNGIKTIVFKKNPQNTALFMNGNAYLTFTYTNGIKIAISVICGISYEGNGDPSNPIIVDRPEIFAFIVPTLPQYYYLQTADLDFSQSNMQVTRVIDNFTGHYDGGGYTISNITTTINSEHNGGIFGIVSGTITDSNDNVIPNIENLTIDNADITATGCANVGILASTVSNGATISGVTVSNSTCTTGSAPVGGLVGTVDGASTVENCSVIDTTVSSEAGCVGGVAGVMNSGSGVIDSCLVSGCTISSGTNSALDIAGGIVAKAVGTVNGISHLENEGDPDERLVLDNCVLDCTISAYYTGGAVGANHYSNTTSSLTVNNVKVASLGGSIGHTSVTSTYSGSDNSPIAAGILAAVVGNGTHPAQIVINNCYVEKNTVITSQRSASGCVGRTEAITNNISSIEITDTEAYANVTAEFKSDSTGLGKMIYAGGLIANTDIDPNKITMDGCVAGGEITATGWKSYAGGAVGYFGVQNSSVNNNHELFVDGVLSARVYSGHGTDASQNPVNCYGKFLGGMDNSALFTDNSYFSTKVFHDNYYSSYPQDYNFFGQHAVDSFQNITAKTVPFTDINTNQNFQISENTNGPWRSFGITNEGESQTFYAKFINGQTSLSFADGRKTSVINESGFSVSGTTEQGNPVFTLVPNPIETVDLGTEVLYQFNIYSNEVGAGSLGAAFDCELSTSLPLLCVEIEGSGTEDEPFQISNPVQLYVVGFLNAAGTYFVQTNDIDLTNTYNQSGVNINTMINYNDGKGYKPIGSSDDPFRGQYDGQGYKITGLYINRPTLDNIGLFGTVASTSATVPAVLKNIHVELLERSNQNTNGIIGDENVGGLVGNVYGQSSTAQIINCSVARSTVIGNNNVGGLCGTTGANVSVTASFTESDVYNVNSTTDDYAGGLIGKIDGGASSGTAIDKCFSSSNVFATTTNVTLKVGNAGGLIGSVASGTSTLSNCLFTGSTNSGHGIYAFKNSGGNTTITVSSVIDAGKSIATNVAKLFAVQVPCVNSIGDNGLLSNVYYDSALLKVADMSVVESMTNVTALKTSQLAGLSDLTGISTTDWTYSADHYPVPKVDSNDAYSVAYSTLLSLVMMTSESEECDDTDETLYGRGLVYPVQLPQNTSSSKITYSSSIFDNSDTVAYPSGYDSNLYGVGTNKNTDLLFEDINDSGNENYGKTSVYRNVFKNGGNGVAQPVLNSGTCFDNGEIIYNLQVPVIFASVTIGGVTYYREMKLPLSYENSYCISTQRQLFALGLASYETAVPGTKFSNFYSANYNYKLITDITISTDNTTVFTPIGSNDAGGYVGKFDGDGHTITNLTVRPSGSNPTGMFSKLGLNAEVRNLNLVNADVSGGDYVGALVGRIISSNVTVSNSSVSGSGSSVVASGSYIGGLIGSVDYSNTTVSSCHADVSVSGDKDSIGGLIGKSSGNVTSCYATGDVSTSMLTVTGGIGGLIGYVQRGYVNNCFASGNVTVDDFTSITLDNSRTYGVGGFVGIAEKGDGTGTNGINCCFSGGNVVFGSETMTGEAKPSASTSAVIGIGGFSGVNSTPITNCYSSAAITSDFVTLKNRASSSSCVLGIGGVCGVALDTVQNVYSSGTVTRPSISDFDDSLGTFYYGVGGAVGTRKQNTSVSVSNAYFDSWTNTDQTMTAIGDENNSSNCKSYTTEELANGSNPGGFDATIWGFEQSAYPYLKDLLRDNVDDAIKVSSILSVLTVYPDEEDYSARSGNGVTMAFTVPTEFKYTDQNTGNETTYRLHWSGNVNGNQVTPVRTKNIRESVDLTVEVVGLEQYGSRDYQRWCAEMRGTYYQPYLIGSVNDWEHVNMTPAEQQAAFASSPLLYGQWATPIDKNNQQTQGTVYYQLMSDIDVSSSQRTLPDNIGKSYRYGSNYISYSGFVLNGNSYAIQNASSEGAYIATLDSSSVLTNIAFTDIDLTAGNNTALVGVNNGSLYDVSVSGTIDLSAHSEQGGDPGSEITQTGYAAGLVAVNNSLIDGCVADVAFTGATSEVGGLVGQNNVGAMIRNSGSAGTMNVVSSTPSTIGAFVAANEGTVSNCFSMVDMTFAGGGLASSIGAFIGTNTAGTVEGCYTRSNVYFTNTNVGSTPTVALLVGTLMDGTVRDCYTAGYLGVYAKSNQYTQNSMAFAAISNTANISAVYVEKSMAGTPSKFGYKYSIVTHRLINMSDVDSSMNTYFVKDNTNKHYPQIKSIINAQNTDKFDENNQLIEFEEGTIIRNYDVVKAYACVANVTLQTKNSMYVDSLPATTTTAVYPTISNDSGMGINISVAPSGVIDISEGTVNTNGSGAGGEATITASGSVDLRSATFNPTLKIKVKTVSGNYINPNFASGFGTRSNTYRVNSAESLQSLYYYGQNENLWFLMSGNINCAGYTFEQIPVFRGKFNAGSSDNTITHIPLGIGNTSMRAFYNMTLTDSLFGLVESNAYLGCFGITGASVSSENDYTAILASHVNHSVIKNVIVTGYVNGGDNSGVLAGSVSNNSNIIGIITSGYINGGNVVGGVVGSMDTSNMEDVLSTAYVCGESNIGGIAGQIVNRSSVDDAIFGGSSTGCAITSLLSQNSDLTDYYADYQLNVSDYTVGSLNESNIMMSSQRLSTVFSNSIDGFSAVSGRYIVPSYFAYSVSSSSSSSGNIQIFNAVELASRLVNIHSGAGMGTVGKYVTITFPDKITSAGQTSIAAVDTALTAVEDFFDKNTTKEYLAINDDTTNHLLRINVSKYDENIISTAVKFCMDDSNSQLWSKSNNFRYITPGIVRTVNVSYTLTDTTGDLTGESVGILIRSLNDGSGIKVENTNVFDKVGSSPENLDAILIASNSSNGFYVADMLPDGYEYSITAQDGEHNSLTVSQNSAQEGWFVSLEDAEDSDISLSISIVASNAASPWGVIDKHSILWQ